MVWSRHHCCYASKAGSDVVSRSFCTSQAPGWNAQHHVAATRGAAMTVRVTHAWHPSLPLAGSHSLGAFGSKTGSEILIFRRISMASALDLKALLPEEVPLDDDHFVVSYEPTDKEGITAFYEKYGFVVVRNVITDEQADKTIAELWDAMRLSSEAMFGQSPSFLGRWIRWATQLIWSTPTGLDPHNPATWGSPGEGGFWPYPSSAGIVGDGIAKGRMAWENRQAVGLFQAFAAVLGTEELIVSCDRMGVMRPTKLKGPGGEVEERPRWRTNENWWHWDMNPWYWTGAAEVPEKDPKFARQAEEALLERWSRPNSAQNLLTIENNNVVDFKGFDKLQGLIALADSGLEDGGFTCVPGFHRVLQQWTSVTDMYNTAHYVSVHGDEIGACGKKIPVRKGSAVLWSSSLPHCNYPNNSDQFRFCQYVKMFPAALLPESEAICRARATAVCNAQPKGFSPSPLGKKLFGMSDERT